MRQDVLKRDAGHAPVWVWHALSCSSRGGMVYEGAAQDSAETLLPWKESMPSAAPPPCGWGGG